MSDMGLTHILPVKWHSCEESSDGRTLTVHFYRSMDRELASVECQETEAEVRVTVLLGLRRMPDGVVLPAMLIGGSTAVTLRKPVSGRTVIDGSTA